MSTLTDSLKAKARAEIAKIEDAATREWALAKTSHFSLTVVAVVAAVAFVLGLVL